MSESKLIEEITSDTNPINANNNDDVTDCVESKSNTNSKRAYLEVNKAEQYKQFMLKPLETKKFKPSETLSKVRDFLPLLKESTSKLLDDFKENPDQLNIENVEEDEEHIEMNLAMVSESESDEDDDDDDDDDGEEESDDEDESEDSSNPLDAIDLDIKVNDKTKLKKMKLPNSNVKKPIITVFDQNDDENSDNEEETQ